MGNSTLPLGGGDRRRISEVVVQAAHGFSAGEAVRHNGTQFVLAQADSAANAEAVGIIESTTINDFEVVYQGRMDISGLGLGTNEVWFLDDSTAGALTLTPPATAGSVIKAMLVTGDAVDGFVTGYVGVQIGGDNTVSLNDVQPVGTILPWAAAAATPMPDGWLLCNGQAVSRPISAGGTTDDYEDLWNLIGTDYGVGDGSTTFNVPDLQRRVALGQDPGAPPLDPFLVQGNSGGQETYSPTAAELPPHDHTHDTLAVFDPGVGPTPYTAVVVGAPGAPTPNIGSSEYGPGGGVANNNLQPYLVINFIIRYKEQATAGLLDHYLDDHADVDVPSPVAGDVLTWNSSTSMWEENRALAGHNYIINGDFRVWQRGTTFPGPPFGPVGNVAFYTADRWRWGMDDDGGTWNNLTTKVDLVPFTLGQTAVPGNPKFHIRVTNDLVGGSGNEFSFISQRLEELSRFSGETMTLSFWAKGAPGTILVNLRYFFGTGGSPSSPFQDNWTPVTITNTWTKYRVVFNVADLTGLTLGTSGNNDFLVVKFINYLGATAAATQGTIPVAYNNPLDIARVQFEKGDVIDPQFEEVSNAVLIEQCQRFYQQSYNIGILPGTSTDVGAYGFEASGTAGGRSNSVEFPTHMRETTPSIAIWDTFGVPNQANKFTGPPVVTDVSVVNSGATGFIISYGFGLPATDDLAYQFHWVADSEL